MSQLLEDLKAVRELISVPERWTQEGNAKNKYGNEVPVSDSSAICFCLWGATVKAIPSDKRGCKVRSAILDCLDSWDHIVDFNDSHTHAEVLAVVDKAIEAAQ